MKTAKVPQADPGPSSSRRAQPVRRARTNPAPNSGLNRSLNGRDPSNGRGGHDQPIDIFPAITHFTDAITSLPKELVRHFTLLKEVDAKIFAPEETLFELIDVALKTNPPEPRPVNDASSSIAPASAPMSAQNSSSGFGANGSLGLAPSTDENYNAAAVYDPNNIPRRQLFRQTAFKIQEMLVSLEEKNHVISTANEALNKQLSRIEDVWPHLEAEFSDEAKWGSTTHWAYPENRAGRNSNTERSQRHGAAAITAAAQALADEAAARSDARKQAVLAKKGLKNAHQDSDFDDHESKQKAEPAKKSHSSKSRKTADSNAATVGLGITTPPVNGSSAPKRRKPDNTAKATNGGAPMERALSGVFGHNATKAKASSPRGTPAPEGTKKRKALPTLNGQAKKSKTGAGVQSPSVTSSPMLSNFPDPKGPNRASPAPTNTRPATSRARQNSTHSNINKENPRPASSASNKPNGILPGTPDIPTHANGARTANEPKSAKEPAVPAKTETPKEEPERPSSVTATTNNSKKESSSKPEETEIKGDAPQVAQPSRPQPSPVPQTVVTTKSGRASKPSTPALGSFPEPTPRSRTQRSEGTTAKRSHKKGAAAQALAARLADEDATSSAQGDDDDVEIDADEPRYCYCNGVSYGAMVACDADDCPREWFHLECVGLKVPPKSNSTWYCDNCKDRFKAGKKVNGR